VGDSFNFATIKNKKNIEITYVCNNAFVWYMRKAMQRDFQFFLVHFRFMRLQDSYRELLTERLQEHSARICFLACAKDLSKAWYHSRLKAVCQPCVKH
jgi:hypothetical protein